jgi:type I restriction enzyme M protein
MAPSTKESQRAELHKMIWRIANDLRGQRRRVGLQELRARLALLPVHLREPHGLPQRPQERAAGNPTSTTRSCLTRRPSSGGRSSSRRRATTSSPASSSPTCARGRHDENLNETLQRVFTNIEGSAVGTESEGDLKGLFDDLDVNSSKLGPTVAKRNEKLVKLLDAIGDLPLAVSADNTIDAFGDAYEYLMTDVRLAGRQVRG